MKNIIKYLAIAFLTIFIFSCNDDDSQNLTQTNTNNPNEDLSDFIDRLSFEVKTNTHSLDEHELSQLAEDMQSTDLSRDEFKNTLRQYFSLNGKDFEKLLGKFSAEIGEEVSTETKLAGFNAILEMNQTSMKLHKEPFHLAAIKGEISEESMRIFDGPSSSNAKTEDCPPVSLPRKYTTGFGIPRFATGLSTMDREEDSESKCQYVLRGYKKNIKKLMPLSPATAAMIAAHPGKGLYGNNRQIQVKILLATAFAMGPPQLVATLAIRKR